MHQAPCVPGRPILGGQRRGPEDERPLESGPCSDCPVTQSRADGPDQSDPDGALSHAAPQKASGPAEACAPAGKMSDQRSARSATPTATLRPVWPCTLSGWRLMEFFEPPTRILGSDANANRGIGIRPNVIASQRTIREIGRGEHGPYDRHGRCKAQIKTDFRDRTFILLRRTLRGLEHAIIMLLRAEDHTDARPALARQGANFTDGSLCRADDPARNHQSCGRRQSGFHLHFVPRTILQSKME